MRVRTTLPLTIGTEQQPAGTVLDLSEADGQGLVDAGRAELEPELDEPAGASGPDPVRYGVEREPVPTVLDSWTPPDHEQEA